MTAALADADLVGGVAEPAESATSPAIVQPDGSPPGSGPGEAPAAAEPGSACFAPDLLDSLMTAMAAEAALALEPDRAVHPLAPSHPPAPAQQLSFSIPPGPVGLVIDRSSTSGPPDPDIGRPLDPDTADVPREAELGSFCVLPSTRLRMTRNPAGTMQAVAADRPAPPIQHPNVWILRCGDICIVIDQPVTISPLPTDREAVSAQLIRDRGLPKDVSNLARWMPPGSGLTPVFTRPKPPELARVLTPATGLVSTAQERRTSWRLLGQHDFRLYFFGSLVSNLGTWLQSTAQVVLAWQVTHSVFMVGLITSAQFAGMILVSPWAAVLADRFSPRAVLVGTQCISALIAAGMVWRYLTDALGVHSLLFGALGLGSAYALALPVQAALVPALVEDEDATDAVKMNSVSYNAARALAPALSVLVIDTAGPYLIFAVNALTFVIFALALRQLDRVAGDQPLHEIIAAFFGWLIAQLTRWCTFGRLRRAFGTILIPAVCAAAIRPVHGAVARVSARRPRARARDGLMIALRNRRIMLLLAIVAAVTLADDPIFVLSPDLAHTRLDISGVWVGYFIAALGWGSVLGSLPPTSARHTDARRASRRAAFSLLVLGTAVVVFTLGRSAQFSLVAAFIAGGAGLFAGAAAQTALMRYQSETGATVASVASVAALWAIAWAGTKPFASLLDGWLASRIGILPTGIVLAAPAIGIAVGELVLPRTAKRSMKDSAEVVTSRIISRFDFPHGSQDERERAPGRADGVTVGPAPSRVRHAWATGPLGQVRPLGSVKISGARDDKVKSVPTAHDNPRPLDPVAL